jgi:hypothetical protein
MRWPGALLVALVAAMSVPAGALAKGHLRIAGEAHLATGNSALLKVNGHTSVHRGLAIYLDDAPCASGVGTEETRNHGISRQLVVRSVHGSFRNRIKIVRSSRGTHYLCAYLYHGKGARFVTDVRATFHYVTG